MDELTDDQRKLLAVMEPDEWYVSSQLRELSGLDYVEIVSDPLINRGLIDNLYGRSIVPWYKLTAAGIEFKKGQVWTHS